ncbi:MAG: ECF-type sigma factor [Planctomycetota bacterium]|nr:ECF-type sigma factor [Planctomycetota bacterium]
MTDITHILNAIDSGDPQGSADLLPLVYAELRRLAAARLAGEKPGQTLEPTGLVHEAYLRLIGNHRELKWDGRGHFFASAAEAMRRILIENARRKQGPRRGGGLRRVDANIDQLSASDHDIDLLDLNEALEQLAAESPVRAELVKLRYFAGLTIPEAAAALGISVATAERYWAFARVRLYAALAEPRKNSENIDPD